MGNLRIGLVGLEHVAAAEAPADAHQCEEDGEQATEATESDLCEPGAQVVHRATGDVSVGADDAVFLAEGALGELGAHAEDAGEHHPHHGPRSPHRHCEADAGDVAESDGGGERRRERLEVGDLARVIRPRVAPPHAVKSVAEGAQVHEVEAKREEDRAEEQPHHHQRKLDLARGAIVPEGEIEHEDRSDGSHHPLGEEPVESGEEPLARIHALLVHGLLLQSGCRRIGEPRYELQEQSGLG